jgi:hypothetical protein
MIMNGIQPQNTQLAHDPASATSRVTTPPQPIPGEKSRRKRVVIGALVVGLCLFMGLCGVVFGAGILKVTIEKPKVERVIDKFMSAMAAKDADKAYTLLSTHSKKKASLADVEKLLNGNNYLLFDGYQSVTIPNFTLNAAFSSDADMPQGTFAQADGTIAFRGGFKGTVNAVLG